MTKINFFRICACVILVTMTLFIHTNNTTTEPEIEHVTRVTNKVDPKQLACLAKNIYFEAGSEPLLGQAAVARVVLNRIKHGFGSNPCNVIYQTTIVQKEDEDGLSKKVKMCQFSWVCDRKTEPNTKSLRYIQAKQVAYDVLAHDAYNDVVPKSTLFFHNASVKPDWHYNQTKKIGNHIFYSKARKIKHETK